ncbi:ABC transporter permease [Mangrovactinospora gilvigrisea]|uniref:ABC transporter permease n=1 Tax=Mangrovactinospora gilvigrisea TaxID=1428644 RepID=A0A1J7BBT8_9ACTN|nr:ABC transporter permease [Mangrovactinospora gilvigrisea]
MPWWRSYLVLLGAAWRSQFQYRANLFIMILSGVAWQGVGFAFIWVVVAKFGTIGGWSLSEIAFIYGIRLTAHGLFVVVSGRIFVLDTVIQEGEFDRYLVRPAGALAQLWNRQFYLPHLGDLLSGLVILIAAATEIPADWNVLTVGFLLLAVLSGGMIEGALQVIAASFAFRTMNTRQIRGMMDDIFSNFGGYPITIFPIAIRLILTFVIPLAFVAFFPSAVLTGRSGGLYVPEWLALMSPLAGPLLVLLAREVWRSQLKHYKSSGS